MKKEQRRNISDTKKIFQLFLYLAIFILAFFSMNIINYFKNDNKNINFTKSKSLSSEDKSFEFDYIANLINDDYPYLDINQRYSNFIFEDEVKKYRTLILDTKDDIEYVKTLKQFISRFNQPNFYLLDSNYYYLYLKYANNHDKSPWYNILNKDLSTSRYSEYKDNTKDKDIFSGLSMKIIEENKTALIKIDNFSSLAIEEDKNLVSDFIKGIENFKYLIIDIRENQGFSIEYPIEVLIKPLAKNTLVMNSVILQRNENFKEFLDYFNNLKNIIVDKEFYKTDEIKYKDLKINNLGLFPIYRKYNIRIEPLNKNIFGGEIYILQGRNTSNSADFLSQFSNITNFATTVGQFTLGNGVNLSTTLISLPRSGFILSIPIGNGINEEGSSNTEFGTYPEIIIDSNYNSLEKLIEMLN